MEVGRHADGGAVSLLAAVGARTRHPARRSGRRVRRVGPSLVGLIGTNPPQPDEFDIRRVEFKSGEILVRVTNPQQDDLTIASVTVDDAIVPFESTAPPRSPGCARARS